MRSKSRGRYFLKLAFVAGKSCLRLPSRKLFFRLPWDKRKVFERQIWLFYLNSPLFAFNVCELRLGYFYESITIDR